MSTHGAVSSPVGMEAVGSLPPILLATPRGVLRMRSDAALAERFRAGYEDAFGALYERHRAGVLAVCIGVLGSRHDAEDAAQDAFAALAVALRTNPPRDLRAWLARVARNASIDLIRRRRVTTEADDTIEGPVRGGPEVKAELESVFMGLRQLPESQRTALLMRELAGHSYQEIADLLALDEAAVRGLIARARIGLRAHREASDMPCAAAREALATELDGRRRDRTVRRHVRGCASCKSYGHGLRKDAHALRSILPVSAGGVASGGAIFGGFAVKTVLTGSVITQVTAACAVSVCAVGGIALFSPQSPAHHQLHSSTAATVGGRPVATGTAATGVSTAHASTRALARAVGSGAAGAQRSASRPSGSTSRPGSAAVGTGKVISSPTVALHQRFQIPGSQHATGTGSTATGTNPITGTASASPTASPTTHPVLGASPGATSYGWGTRAGGYGWAGWWSGGGYDTSGSTTGGSGAGTGSGTGSTGTASGSGTGGTSSGSGSTSSGTGTSGGSGSTGTGSGTTGSGTGTSTGTSGGSGTGTSGSGSSGTGGSTGAGGTGGYGYQGSYGYSGSGSNQSSAATGSPGSLLGSW